MVIKLSEYPVRKKSKSNKPEKIAALALFRHEVICYLKFSKQAAEAEGITPQQYQAMLFIKGFSENGKMSIGEFAEKLLTTHHSAVEMADRMEAAGLLLRQVEESDRRRVSVELTARGARILEKLAAQHLAELSHSELARNLQKISPS